MLQKYLAFDEPTSRCIRMKKFVAKQLRSSAAKEKDLSGAGQIEQDQLFDAVYGGRPTLESCRLLSVLLALEEIACFDEIAFASWAIDAGAQDANLPFNGDFWTGLQNWFADANLSEGQIRWLNHCAMATPNWSMLTSDGPWTGTSLADFLKQALKQLEQQFGADAGYTTRTFARAHANFVRLLKTSRSDLPGDFIPQSIVIVEGPTEEILLPRFGKLLGLDFQTHAFMIVSAGGAKQVAKRYLFLRDIVALPIICLLDRDAEEQATIISDSLRDCDKLFVLQGGEIEDTFEPAAFARQLNHYLESFPGSAHPVMASDFAPGSGRKAKLAKLWKERKLGDFDKIAFAESVAQNLATAGDVPQEFVQIVKFLAEVAAENG